LPQQPGGLASGQFRAHIPGMSKAKLYLFLIGFWVVLAALSFLIVGYDQTIRILPFAVAFLVSGLAILWWSVRAKT
jgi:hypothetical protein